MLSKGSFVVVAGELSTREWQDKQGAARTAIEVRVSELTLGPRQNGASAQQTSAAAADMLEDQISF